MANPEIMHVRQSRRDLVHRPLFVDLVQGAVQASTAASHSLLRLRVLLPRGGVGSQAVALADGVAAEFPVFALLISTLFESYVWSALAFIGLALGICGNIIMIRAR